MSVERIDDCLSTRDGHLYIEECDTTELARRFGTPLFVLSEDQLRRNVRRFQKAFQDGWSEGPVKILPAAKANWITAVQRILVEEGCGCDIYSPGELSVALAAGFDPSFISVNGVPKDEAHIYRAIEAGARLTIDSVEEVDILERAVLDLNRTAYVRLRLKPTLPGFIRRSDFVSSGLAPTDIVAMAYKGGLTYDQIMQVGPRVLKMKNVALVGFHQHHGRHSRKAEYWVAQMKAYAAEVGRVCKALGGYQPQELDIGGGFAVPRDPFNAATDYKEPLLMGALHTISKAVNALAPSRRYQVMGRLVNLLEGHPNREHSPSIEEYAAAVTGTLREELPKHGVNLQGLMLQLEPGRSMHGNTGIHLTQVRNLKPMINPYHWDIVIVDSSEFWFTGGVFEHHLHDYVFANKTDAPLTSKADIIGRSCYGDRLYPQVRVPVLSVGDLLAMLDTGAYQEVSMSNFNAMPRPGTVLVRGSEAHVVRRPETEEDVFRRDIVPDHLKKA